MVATNIFFRVYFLPMCIVTHCEKAESLATGIPSIEVLISGICSTTGVGALAKPIGAGEGCCSLD